MELRQGLCGFLLALSLIAGSVWAAQTPTPKPTAEVQKLLDQASDQKLPILRRLALYQAATRRAKELGDRPGEVTGLLGLGETVQIDRTQTAIKLFLGALSIAKGSNLAFLEASADADLAAAYRRSARIPEAKQAFLQAAVIFERLGDKSKAGHALRSAAIMLIYAGSSPLGVMPQVLQSSSLFKSCDPKQFEAQSVLLSATLQMSGNPKAALAGFRKGLQLSEILGDQELIGLGLLGILVCDRGTAFRRRLPLATRALAIWTHVGDVGAQAESIGQAAYVYHALGEYRNAVTQYQVAYRLFHSVSNRKEEASALIGMGGLFRNSGEIQRALQCHKNALDLVRQSRSSTSGVGFGSIDRIYDLEAEASALHSVAMDHFALGELDIAVKECAEALSMAKAANDADGCGSILNTMGMIYDVGLPFKAQECYTEALRLARQQGNRINEAAYLENLGTTRALLGRPEEALADFQEALAIVRELGHAVGQTVILSNMGRVYAILKEPSQALKYHRLSLEMAIAIHDSAGEAIALNNIACVERELAHFEQALQYFKQALPLERSCHDRSGEAVTLGNIGQVIKATNPSLAIWYEKRAVNLYQSLRRDAVRMPAEFREAYKNSMASAYRSLADLLISQGRIPEAEQVLRLLKDDEVYEFVRRMEAGLGGIASYTSIERKWDQQYEAETKGLAELGAKIGELRNLTEPTPEQKALLLSLNDKLTVAEGKFQDFLDRLVKKSKDVNVGQNRLNEVGDATSIRTKLRQLPPGTVAIYTVAGSDALRIIFLTPTVARWHTYSIKSEALSRLVGEFRKALRNPTADPKVPGKALYNALIQPIEEDLRGSGAKTIMWSLDGALRYIPIAALWDGQRYLAERFDLSIFNPSWDRALENTPQADWRALAAGVSMGRKVVDEDGVEHSFDPLSGVPKELDSVVATFPRSKELLDPNFTVKNFFDGLILDHPSLVHLATHFSFNSGDETKSFLLTGQGPVLDIGRARKVSAVPFQGVSLLTLSACETALGGVYGDGSEVESIAVIFQRKGAEAVLSTLWSVADEPTRLLMTRFYGNRKAHADWTKLKCLREAQLALLHGDEKGNGPPRAEVVTGGSTPTFKADLNAPLSHPYYWAPFVLSGNWK